MKKLRKTMVAALCTLFVCAVALFAVACSDTVTLSFETGEGPAVESVEVKKGESFTLPSPAVWEGHFFEGWYLDASCSGDALGGSITAPEKDATYYAKWTTAYLLTLDADGGALGGETTLWLKEGALLSDAVGTLVPQKDGLVFGAWFNGDKELSADDAMPAAPLTLTAHWKVEYTANVYLQELDSETYVMQSAHAVKGMGYVGTTVAPEAPHVDGFALTSNAAEKRSLLLTASAAENQLSFYYDREARSVFYLENLPEGTESEGNTPETHSVFGGTVSVAANGYTAKGFLFAGWSTSPDGEIEYQPGAELTLQDDVFLYAVWNVGNKDVWGGDDLIYLLKEKAGSVLLERLGETYEGTIGENGVFTVVEMTGMLYEGGLFAYYREDFAATFYCLDGYYHENREDDIIDETNTLILDGYLHAKHVCIENSAEKTEEGYYGYDEEAKSYFASFGGEKVHFRLGSFQGEAVFGFEGKEAGAFDQFVPSSATGGYGGDYAILLDGYGGVIIGDLYTDELYEGSYDIEPTGVAVLDRELEFYHTHTALGDLTFFNYPLMDGDALILQDDFAGEYSGVYGGSETTLTLDGFGFLLGATLDGKEYSYYLSESELFGMLVHLFANGSTVATLAIDNEKGTFLDIADDDFLELIFLMQNEEGDPGFYYPLVLLYEVTGGYRAELWSIETADGPLVKVADASCTADTKIPGYKLYTLTATTFYVEDHTIFPIDEPFESASILVGNDVLIIDYYYLLGFNGENLYDEYTAKAGNEKIWITVGTGVSGTGAFYFDANGTPLEGSFELTYTNIDAFGMTAVEFVSRFTDDDTSHFYALYEESQTFEPLLYEPYSALRMDEYGTLKQPAGVYFDGLGNAYYFTDADDHFNNIYVSGPLSVAEEKTVLGADIYVITPAQGEPIRFVLEPYSVNTKLAYVYYSEPLETECDNGKLTLDGFNYRASYTTADGDTFTGEYHMLDPKECNIPAAYECAYVMQVSGSLFWRFYVKADGTFDPVLSLLGNMDKAFLVLMDDSYCMLGMFMIELDGIEPAYTYIGSDESVSIMCTVSLENAETLEMKFSLFLMSEENEDGWQVEWTIGEFEEETCVRLNQELKGSFQGGHAAELELDGYGYADYLDKFGFYKEGAYVLFDGTHIALEFAESSGGGVVTLKLDAEKNSFEELDLSDFKAVYVAEDGSVAEFDDYFSVDGVSLGFWYAEDGKVYFMVFDDDEGVYNKASFDVGAESFTYEGKTYYLSKDDGAL